MNKIKLLSSLTVLVSLVTLSSCGEVSDQYEDRIIVPKEEEDDQEVVVETGDILTSGLLGCEVDGTYYFATGVKTNDPTFERGVLTCNIDKAPVFTLTETSVENGYYLSCEVEGETVYLYFKVPARTPSNNPLVVGFTSTPTVIYYDQEYQCFIDEDNTHYLCWEYNLLGTNNIIDERYAHVAMNIIEKPTITSLMISSEEESVTEGFSLDLDVSYSPSTIKRANLYWSSSDEGIATVENGVVTGVSEGSCQIYAMTTNGLRASYEITVKAKTGETVTKSRTLTPLGIIEDLGLCIRDNLSQSVSTYEGFSISWFPSGDPTSTGLGIFARTGAAVSNYETCLYMSSSAGNTNFFIFPAEGAKLSKLTFIGASDSSYTYGTWFISLTNTDYDYNNQTPTKLDDGFDMIEANVEDGTTEVNVKNNSSSGQCNIYSITVEYEITM